MTGRGGVLAAALLLAITLAGCTRDDEAEDAPPPAPKEPATEVPLAAAQIRQTLVGNSLYRKEVEIVQDLHIASFYRHNGTMRGRAWRKVADAEVAEGTWEVTDADLYCRTWQNHWGGGERGCFRVIRFGEEIIFVANDVATEGEPERYIYRVLIGNAYGL